MSRIYIKNGRVILKDRILDDATVIIDNGKIAAISKKKTPKKSSFIINAKGCFVSPGFIDCHIHGEPEKIFLNEAKHGMTAFVVTQSCASIKFIYKKVEAIKEFIKSSPLGGNVLGIRLEGPYINKEKAGAQDLSYIKNPNAKELSSIISKCLPILKIMTIAPELQGALPLIRLLDRNGVIASIGHSDATYEEAVGGISAGIRHATHTFNAMSGIDRREPGTLGAIIMDDRVTAEIILDLIHVHKALFNLLVKAKKKDRVIIVTDSLTSEIASEKWDSPNQRDIAAFGTVPIFPRNDGDSIAMTGGAYRFQDGRLAGSCLTMIEALKNAVMKCGIPLLDAVRTITLNPAKLLGAENRKGEIAVGKDADIVVFDKKFDVKMTMIRGKIAYSKKVTKSPGHHVTCDLVTW